MEVCRIHLGKLFAVVGAKKMNALNRLFEMWVQNGLAVLEHHWVELTIAGQFWQQNLAQALLEWNAMQVEGRNNG